MTRDEAIALVQQGLGFRTDLATQIAAAMTRAIAEFEGPHRTLPKFLIEEDDTIALTAGAAEFTKPTGFLRIVESEGPNYSDSTYGRIFLPRRDFDYAETFFNDVDPGRPQAYVIRTEALKFYPTPDINYTLTWSWYKSNPLPSGGANTNLWLTNWPYLLIARAGMFIAQDTQQNEGENSAYARFARDYGDWNRLWVAQIAGEEDDNAPKSMGSNY